jgi:cobalt-zinc-cadmium resistance protein CzcA
MGRSVRSKFPQLNSVFSRSSTSEAVTDPMPPNETDFYVCDKPIAERP